jgi:uncharacterized heparinase superfamily protein
MNKKGPDSVAMTGSWEKLSWYTNRLAAMEPAEVAHRAVEISKRRVGRRRGGWGRYSLGSGSLPYLPFEEARFSELAWKLSPHWQALWRMAQQGQWHLLGQHWPAVNAERGLSKAVWHLDPVTNREWPSTQYCFDIPYRHAHNMGDIKYVWELNRLQFLPPLAALARHEKDENVRNWCLATLESWIDANPPFLGVNWASGIELAIRSVSLILAISLLGADSVPAELAAKLRAALHAHAVWLARYPSRFSSANNHLISEAGALYILGATMTDLPRAARYLRYGLETLISEAELQILDDGVGAEQSPTYAAFTLEWYLLVKATLATRGESFPAKVMERLHRAATFLRWITDKSGSQPRIGDDDEGRVLVSSADRETDYVASILSCLSAATGDSTVAPPARRPHLRELFVSASGDHPDGPEGIRSFDSGGYTVFRQEVAGRQTMMVFDHGPLGYRSIAAHGHADALSVWLHIDEDAVLIDAGTYLYHSGGVQRDYFRGTRAHNTLTLQDADQSRISGPFNWSTKAQAWRVPYDEDTRSRITARHDGYQKKFGVLHERSVSFEAPNGYVITDRLVGTLREEGAVARIRYVLSPEVDVSQPTHNCADLSVRGHRLASITTTIGPGDTPSPIQVFDCEVSLHFGSKIATKCIVAECPARALTEHVLKTLILL